MLLGGGLAVTLGAVLVLRATSTRPAVGPDAAERVRVVRRDVASLVKATGVVKPMAGAEVRVGSRASGVVKRLHVRVGDQVAEGQVLAELDARDLVARRDQATAALLSARASLAWARADATRKRRLSAERLLSPSELDLAERSAAVAETAEAEAAASLAFAATQLGYARIAAPIAGTVASVATQEGETVAASLAAPTFVTLLDLARLELWAYVDETDVGRVRPGQDARFTVDTYPGVEFSGRVVTIYPKPEIRDNVVDYVTVIRFDAPREETLRPEMTATVRIARETRAAVLTIPRRAVRREGGRTYVIVPGEPGSRGPVRRWVTTGAGDESGWEIRDGLREGDEVLVEAPSRDAKEGT